MILAGKSVAFQLSLEGEEALNAVFAGRGSFTAYVVAQDDVGVWITHGAQASSGATPVLLLKWQYIKTVAFDVLPEEPRKRIRPGFR